MTLLEYLCMRLMGRANSGRCWPCPYCGGKTSFFVLPHKPEFKDSFKCFRCSTYGDVYDILKLLHPKSRFPERREMVPKYEREFAIWKATDSSFSRGPGTDSDAAQPSPGKVDVAWADVITDLERNNIEQRMGRLILELIVKNCEANKSTPQAVLDYWIDFDEWCADLTRRHAKECDDPLCSDECRAARGLPALTEKQRQGLEAGLRKQQLT